ncbi:Glu/Leu/Phe/Val dehydrogenase dimerization domain-containing protein [Streptomyces zhihengii]
MCWSSTTARSPPQLRARFEQLGSDTDAVDAASVPARLGGRYQAVVLSGTKVRAYDTDYYRPLIDLVHSSDVPVFGICGGMQILAVSAGGRLADGPQRVGGFEVQVDKEEPLFTHVKPTVTVFHRHTLYLQEAPEGFRSIGRSEHAPSSSCGPTTAGSSGPRRIWSSAPTAWRSCAASPSSTGDAPAPTRRPVTGVLRTHPRVAHVPCAGKDLAMSDQDSPQEPAFTVSLNGSGGSIRGWVVVDSLYDGLAMGGTRRTAGVTEEEVAGLARDMTDKFTLARLPIGGAKAGIVADDADREETFRTFGRTVKPLLHGGIHLGIDMGVTPPTVPCSSTRRATTPATGSVPRTCPSTGAPTTSR